MWSAIRFENSLGDMMNSTAYAAFVADVRDQLAANDAAREARIAALVARAPWAEWSASVARVES